MHRCGIERAISGEIGGRSRRPFVSDGRLGRPHHLHRRRLIRLSLRFGRLRLMTFVTWRVSGLRFGRLLLMRLVTGRMRLRP
jgi:hypothetical protein